jgi:hypothetical protein
MYLLMSLVDDGGNKPNITIIFTLISLAVSFAWLGVVDPSKWRIGVGLYIVGCELYKVLLDVIALKLRVAGSVSDLVSGVYRRSCKVFIVSEAS